MEEIMQRIASFFSSPDLRKGIPGYAVSGCSLADITLPDMVTLITLLYTIVLLIGALPGVWKAWDFFMQRRHGDRKEDGE